MQAEASTAYDWARSKQDQGCKLYLQPLCSTGSDGQVLAGGWTRFSHLKLLAREDASSKIFERVVPLDELADLEKMPAFRSLLHSITKTRAPLGTVSMDAPALMGIVNVTPDSFSDGGQNFEADTAIAHGLALEKAGAAILDIGGESTRPGADVVGEAEEQKRVLPVIEGLAAKSDALLSIDTRNPVTMASAVRAGAGLVNDVTALEHRTDSLRTAARLKRPVCLMHMRGQPKNMQAAPVYSNVVLDVYDYLEARVEACLAAGMDRSNIVLDVGIGFGKMLDHNLALLANLSLFHALGCPLLLGASRKSFIDKICSRSGHAIAPEDRLAGSIAAMLKGVQQGVQILRVHDVVESHQALSVWRRIGQ